MKESRVFVNRTLNMKRIRYVGFDMDHTLVRYHAPAFERIAFNALQTRMASDYGYPSALADFVFEPDRAIRGLVVDKATGNLLKLSRFSAIRSIYHGTTRVHHADQRSIYPSTYVDLRDKRYDTIDTQFSLAYASFYTQLVDLKDRTSHVLPSYEHMADDLLICLDRIHKDGYLKGQVSENISKFIIQSPGLVTDLERYLKHGKKLFVVTNSEYSYAKLLLDYTITPFLKEHTHWSEVFELVITRADKPRFFFDATPFQVIDPETQDRSLLAGPLRPGIYQDGNAQVMMEDLKLHPEEILYIGDHIYGDVLRLKKACGWRTALVIEELAQEIEMNHVTAPLTQEILSLMAQKLPLEEEVDRLSSNDIEHQTQRHEGSIQTLLKAIEGLDHKISALIVQRNQHFNPYWGELMYEGIEETFFAHQMERFACIYMSTLEDFLRESPRKYYRASKRRLAHETDG